MAFRGIQAETVKFHGFNGESGEAYYARPSAPAKYPGVVVIHHFPVGTNGRPRSFTNSQITVMPQSRRASTSGSVTELHRRSWRAHAQRAECRMIR
jgi:hypothetical protein